MELPFIKETAMQNSGLAYMIAKRVNQLQAMKAAARMRDIITALMSSL